MEIEIRNPEPGLDCSITGRVIRDKKTRHINEIHIELAEGACKETDEVQIQGICDMVHSLYEELQERK